MAHSSSNPERSEQNQHGVQNQGGPSTRRARSPARPGQAGLAWFACAHHKSLSDARLLLRHAMKSAEAEDEIAAGDAHDFAIGE